MKINLLNNIFDRYFSFINSLKRNYKYSPKFLIFSFIIIFIILFPHFGEKYHFSVGEISDRSIKSPKDIIVYDKNATLNKIQKALQNALPVFDFKYDLISQKNHEVQRLFEFLRKNYDNLTDNEVINKFKHIFNYNLTQNELKLLKKFKFSEDIEFAILKGFTYFMEKGVVADNSSIYNFANKGIILRNVSSGEEITKKDIYSFFKYSKVKSYLFNNFELITDFHFVDKNLKYLVIKLIYKLVSPDIVYNPLETERLKERIKKKVRPVYYLIKKNEIIVREGEKITEDILTKLNAIQETKGYVDIIKKASGIFIFLLILGVFLNQILIDDINCKKIDMKDTFFLLTSLVITAIFFRISIGVSLKLIEHTTNLSTFLLLFMIPYVLPVILVTIVLRGKYSYLITLFVCLFCFFIFGPKLLLFSLFGSIYMIKRYKCCLERITFFKLGIELGLLNVLIIFAIKLFFSKSSLLSSYTFQEISGGFIGGILNFMFVLGIIPVIELMYKYTTDLRLIELGNLEHPLLKDFLIKAPGSYHHSMIVGNLAEAAAEAIGANPLLARVGSYYHDIGKMNKPQYFIENIDPKNNKHEKLSPFMSALILISHVKDGVELVEKYKIGDEIIDIIKQHHGTSLIKFFYNKALELKKQGLKEDIDEKDFRYPGPKPQTKEAGIVMLADVVEAASKSLQDPTPARIKGLVKKMVDSYYNDGQLDECELTLKDLNKIKEVFTKILTGIFHQRIEYPDDKNIQRNKAKQQNNGKN